MEPVIVTHESFDAALAWINGARMDIDEKEVRTLIDTMAKGYRRRYRELYPWGTVPHTQTTMTNLPTIENICGPEAADMVAKTMKEIQERREKKALMEAEAGKLKELNKEGHTENSAEAIDSVLLINSISHVARDSGQSITESRAQLILYCLYGSHLAHTGIRLETEHPQAWRYGPVFPRAYKKGSIGDVTCCSESYDMLRSSFPDVASRLEGKTSSMLYTPMVDLNACHKGSSSPYGKTVTRNPNRWGVQIDDGLIREFFSRNRT